MGLFKRMKGSCDLCGRECSMDKAKPPSELTAICKECGSSVVLFPGHDWRVSFKDQSGKLRRRKIGPDRKTAEIALAKYMMQVREDTFIPRHLTVRQLLDGYEKHIKEIRRSDCFKSEQSVLKRLALGFGPKTRIDKIKEKDIERYRECRIRSGRAPATTNRELFVLSAAYSWAIKQGFIFKKPKITNVEVRNEQTRLLTKEEGRRLIAECTEPVSAVVRAVLETGASRAELLDLTWSDVDLGAGIVTIPNRPPHRNRARYVPITEELRHLLETRKNGSRRVFDPITKSQTVWRNFDKAKKRAGLQDVRFHDLRYTAAAWMIQAGKDLYTVAAITGSSYRRMNRLRNVLEA